LLSLVGVPLPLQPSRPVVTAVSPPPAIPASSPAPALDPDEFPALPPSNPRVKLSLAPAKPAVAPKREASSTSKRGGRPPSSQATALPAPSPASAASNSSSNRSGSTSKTGTNCAHLS